MINNVINNLIVLNTESTITTTNPPPRRITVTLSTDLLGYEEDFK